MNRDDKKRIIAELIDTRGKLQRLQLNLALDGTDTTDLDAKQHELDQAIDDIRRKLHESWQERASDIQEQLRRSKRRVQRRIRDINQHVSRAQRLVDLLGDIEEIIGIVRKILP